MVSTVNPVKVLTPDGMLDTPISFQNNLARVFFDGWIDPMALGVLEGQAAEDYYKGWLN